MIRDCTEPLARVLLTAVLAAGIERVVVIGGFALSVGNVYRELLIEAMSARCDYRVIADRIRELVVMGDEDSCLFGAAAYARHMGLR